MDQRHPIDTKASAIMLLLCFVWGFQPITLKAVAADISPIMHIALRSAGAALLVAALMRWRGERFDWTAWRPGILVAMLFALEFVLVGEALVHTSASHTVVFLYSAPVFAALGLHWKLPAERLNTLQWLGIALAFAGVATAFLGRDAQPGGGPVHTSLWGDFLAVLAAAFWGATTVAIRTSRLSQTPPTQTLLYQLLGAAVLLLVFAAVSGRFSVHFTPAVVASLVFQTVVVSFISFLAWFWLLRHYLASRLGVFSFLTPIFGVVLGVLLLNEPIALRFVVGALMVLAGVVVVSAHNLITGWWSPKPSA